MNRKSFVLPVVVIVFVVILALTKCGGSGARNDVKQDSFPAKVNAPAPDNNSANNPSLADTAYQKDSTRKKDTVH